MYFVLSLLFIHNATALEPITHYGELMFPWREFSDPSFSHNCGFGGVSWPVTDSPAPDFPTATEWHGLKRRTVAFTWIKVDEPDDDDRNKQTLATSRRDILYLPLDHSVRPPAIQNIGLLEEALFKKCGVPPLTEEQWKRLLNKKIDDRLRALPMFLRRFLRQRLFYMKEFVIPAPRWVRQFYVLLFAEWWASSDPYAIKQLWKVVPKCYRNKHRCGDMAKALADWSARDMAKRGVDAERYRLAD